jgi:signal transduction histidine kinase
MKLLARRSLEFQLAARLATLYVVATIVAVAALVYQAYSTADSLSILDLGRRAADLAALVTAGEDGKPRFHLPPSLATVYESPADIFFFAVRGPDGGIIAASNLEIRDLVSGWPAAGEEPSYFRLEQFGGGRQDYHGITMRVAGPAGPLSVTVARATDSHELAYSVLREFVRHIAWTIPIIVVATLAIGVLAIRRGLLPLRLVSSQAAAINPARMSVRLPEENLPTEVRPLVEAMNLALDRLEKGFAVQREFTANAAHELRTPLAVVAAGLEQVEVNDELAKLKLDVARMSRLVEQLLRVARLDAIALDVSDTVDLSVIVAEVVAYMAPFAVAQKKSLGAYGIEQPVYVKGNRYAIEDAVRNLVENALTHAPPDTEVAVGVERDGSVRVADRGCGVRIEERDHIFDRFWRGKGSRGCGAGLGLAIVKEIMKAHHGRVVVEDNPGGGAVFVLCFSGRAEPA